MAEDNDISRRRTYTDIVQASIGRTDRLKRNVLEISLEKETKFDEVNDEMISRFLRNIGVRREYVEGIQFVPPKSPKKVFV